MKNIIYHFTILSLTACFASCVCDCPEECECGGSCGSHCTCPNVITLSALSASPSKFKDGETITLSINEKVNASVNGVACKFKAEYYVDDKFVAESEDEANKFTTKVTLRGYAVGAHKLTAKIKESTNFSGEGIYGESSSEISYGPITIYVKK